MVGKTSTIKKILQFKSTLFVKPYERWVYVSPNLQSMHLPHEEKLKAELTALALPQRIDYMSELPEIDEIMQYAQNANSKVCWILDDWNEELWSSKPVSHLFTRLSSHFGMDIICENT